jgi:hypothetical protein
MPRFFSSFVLKLPSLFLHFHKTRFIDLPFEWNSESGFANHKNKYAPYSDAVPVLGVDEARLTYYPITDV